jgi:hypothetical protein
VIVLKKEASGHACASICHCIAPSIKTSLVKT